MTALFSQFKLRERDGYLSRLNLHVPLATKKELRVSPLVGEYLFDEVLVSPGGGQATGRCLLEVQHHYFGHTSQKESGPQGPDFSPA